MVSIEKNINIALSYILVINQDLDPARSDTEKLLRAKIINPKILRISLRHTD